MKSMDWRFRMDRENFIRVIQDSGVVGAGGAGFPSYAKIDKRTEILLLNCAECEPLLKLHRQLLEKHTYEILKTLRMIADFVDAKEVIVGIKQEYKAAVWVLQQWIDEAPCCPKSMDNNDEITGIRLHLLDSIYPAGDEMVLIYEATGKVVRQGDLPIEEGVIVFNVETVYNIYLALEKEQPVSSKVISVVGEVKNPVTVRVPIGCTLSEVVTLAGGATVKTPVYLVGGPMMGNIGSDAQPVTKTTNAIIVLPEDHMLVQSKRRSPSIDLKRAASVCCQCQMCSDLCPRNALGHPIEPHKFMRSASNRDFQDTNAFINTLFCSSCGLCEMYSCPQGLAPRSLMAEYKSGLRKAGIRPPEIVKEAKVKESREYRKVPEERLEARLGLTVYNKDASLDPREFTAGQVKIPLSQHIGIPAKPCVKKGEIVKTGQMIGEPAKGLSVGVHASIDGQVTEVTNAYIVIRNQDRKVVGLHEKYRNRHDRV